MAIKGLEQAIENLSRISKTAVPGAAAMAINRVPLTVAAGRGMYGHKRS
ncbi:phage tail protein [Escherichia coli]